MQPEKLYSYLSDEGLADMLCNIPSKYPKLLTEVYNRFLTSIAENRINKRRLEFCSRSYDHDCDKNEHWVTAWVCQGEYGNAGFSGRFIARAKDFVSCIDKFLIGDIVRVD